MPSTFRASGINTTAVYKGQRIPECASSSNPVAGNSSSAVRDIGVPGDGEIWGARIPWGSSGSYRKRCVPRSRSGEGPVGGACDQLTSWKSPGRVTRLRREDVAGRPISDAMKGQLAQAGIPVTPRPTEHVTALAEDDPSLFASGGPLHRLTEQTAPDAPAERPSFGVEPETGTVHFVLPDGEAPSPTRGSARGWTPFTATAPTSPPRRSSVSPTVLRSTSPRPRKSRHSRNWADCPRF